MQSVVYFKKLEQFFISKSINLTGKSGSDECDEQERDDDKGNGDEKLPVTERPSYSRLSQRLVLTGGRVGRFSCVSREPTHIAMTAVALCVQT